MSNSPVYRDMMIHLATPGEEKYIDAHDDEESTQRAWLLLGKNATQTKTKIPNLNYKK